MARSINFLLDKQGRDTHVVIRIGELAVDSVSLQVELAEHDEIASFWTASLSCEWDGKEFRGKLLDWDGEYFPRIVEVTRVSDASGNVIDQIVDTVFLESAEGWISGEVASNAKSEMLQRQRNTYDHELRDEHFSGDESKYAVIAVAANLYLTQTQRVSGIDVLPMRTNKIGSEVGKTLDEIVLELGFPSGIDLTAWDKMIENRFPSSVLVATKVRAMTAEKASIVFRGVAHRLLRLLALRRGASPLILGGAVYEWVSETESGFCGTWVEGNGYAGNLLGGSISGEDQHGLVQQWKAVNQDSRIELWLALYADYLAEDRWDYRMFRLWSLLEAIA